jgi:hypothetical protein
MTTKVLTKMPTQTLTEMQMQMPAQMPHAHANITHNMKLMLTKMTMLILTPTQILHADPSAKANAN